MVLLQWFLDDGNSLLRKRKEGGWTQKKKQVVITFCTECFSEEDQIILCDKINNAYDLNTTLKPIVWKNSKGRMKGFRIGIPQQRTKQFYEVLGECPINSMEYKWK